MNYPSLITVSILLLTALSACNTGIESTKTIKMSRTEQRDTRPGAEELLAAEIRSPRIGEWRPGKPFLVADNKAEVLLEYHPTVHKPGPTDSLAGRIIRYSGFDVRPTPGGSKVTVIEFRDSCGYYLYYTEQDESRAEGITGLDLPSLIDLDMVAATDSLLKGMKVWTLSSLWYDGDLNIVKGRKFVPISIVGVKPGNMVFPMLLDFLDDKGAQHSMYMNVNASKGLGAESRTFPSLFSLTDPKLRYPAISAETWELIQNGKVAVGMTKEECRLALGTPADVDAGHNWSSVIDVWGYKDGTFLQFQDGLLVNFRH